MTIGYNSHSIVCTPHSPFIIRSLETCELRSLEPGGVAFGHVTGRGVVDQRLGQADRQQELPVGDREEASSTTAPLA